MKSSKRVLSQLRDRRKQLALPLNSHKPIGSVNAKDAAGVGVNTPNPFWFWLPMRWSALEPFGSFKSLNFWKINLESVEPWSWGKLRFTNSGASLNPLRSSLRFRSSSTYFRAPTPPGRGILRRIVESVDRTFLALNLACHDQITSHRLEAVARWGYLLLILFYVFSSPCVVGCGKRGRGGFQMEWNSHSMGITMPVGLAGLKV